MVPLLSPVLPALYRPRLVTLLKTLALVFAVVVILQTYRLALFFTAFYTA